MDDSREEEEDDVGQEGTEVINGIVKKGEDKYRVYLAAPGDISPTHKKFLGLHILGKRDYTFEQLLEAVNITEEYKNKLRTIKIGEIAQMMGANEIMAMLDKSADFYVEKFGVKLPYDMFNTKKGAL